MKAYNVANQSQAEMLLAENIDAFSAGDSGDSGDSGDGTSYNGAYEWLRQDYGTVYVNGQAKSVTCQVYKCVAGNWVNCTIGQEYWFPY